MVRMLRRVTETIAAAAQEVSEIFLFCILLEGDVDQR